MSDQQLLKSLRYRSCHRGTKEADLLLGGFADEYLSKLSSNQLLQFEKLLSCPDHDILAWVYNQVLAPEEKYKDILLMLHDYSNWRTREDSNL